MATLAAVAPKPTTSASFYSKEAENVSARRLKKRETDRRCQRQARERTKSQIAYLETLVEELRCRDSTVQVSALTKRLQEVEAERDFLARTLNAIAEHPAINRPLEWHGGTASKAIPPRAPDDLEHAVNGNPAVAACCGNDLAPAFQTGLAYVEAENSPTDTLNVAQSTPLEDGDSYLNTILTWPRSPSQPTKQLDILNQPDPRHASCSCTTHISRRPGHRPIWQGNYWRYSCEILEERFEWAEDVQPADDTFSDDVPIRALVEGWDAVKRRPLHPSWLILSRIDQVLFPSMPKPERLAMLKAMHLLLQFHLEPTLERYTRLPPWYSYRPVQNIPHTYGVDFFAWPGFRERCIFNEHTYCCNDFWIMYQRNLRLLWPHGFEGCYMRDTRTGLYRSTPMFEQRIREIKCWTMAPDFFARFPELWSDIPASDQIPQSLSPSPLPKRLLPHARGLQAGATRADEDNRKR
jgi:hypothetical protein